jgi:hypothetical protein
MTGDTTLVEDRVENVAKREKSEVTTSHESTHIRWRCGTLFGMLFDDNCIVNAAKKKGQKEGHLPLTNGNSAELMDSICVYLLTDIV